MITVLIADDHSIVREGLRMVLQAGGDVTVVGTAESGEQAVARVAELRPDVVMMDLSMPGMGGIAAIAQLSEDSSGVPVIALTTFGDRDMVLGALDAGAAGYLMKDATPEALRDAVVTAAAGGSPIDPRVARTLLDARRPDRDRERSRKLTAKQEEVVRLVAEGMPNRLIGRRLGISEKTVKAHLTQIYQTIGVTDRVQAANWVRDHLD